MGCFVVLFGCIGSIYAEQSVLPEGIHIEIERCEEFSATSACCVYQYEQHFVIEVCYQKIESIWKESSQHFIDDWAPPQFP